HFPYLSHLILININMKNFFLFGLLLLATLFSCTTEEADNNIGPVAFKNIGDLDGLDRGDCFDFVYPVTYIMPDGSTTAIENEGEVYQLRVWYQENPRYTQRPAFQYPVEVVAIDGTISTVISNSELREAYSSCEEEECFVLVYPVIYIMPDGSLIPAASDDSTGEFLRWYNENPGVQERPVLQYPVDIVFPDGTTQTINTEAEMQEVIADCE
ncbi:MAG: hypothetical protein R2764_13060, partial [Bacteroidales bacterium]